MPAVGFRVKILAVNMASTQDKFIHWQRWVYTDRLFLLQTRTYGRRLYFQVAPYRIKQPGSNILINRYDWRYIGWQYGSVQFNVFKFQASSCRVQSYSLIRPGCFCCTHTHIHTRRSLVDPPYQIESRQITCLRWGFELKFWQLIWPQLKSSSFTDNVGFIRTGCFCYKHVHTDVVYIFRWPVPYKAAGSNILIKRYDWRYIGWQYGSVQFNAFKFQASSCRV